jgi:hypothetical protein
LLNKINLHLNQITNIMMPHIKEVIMEDATEARKTKDRSPRFPFISLERALERASEFYAKEKRGAAPFASAATHWGYSPSSSGALQTFAALRSYGVLEGGHKSMRLSNLAIRILLDKRPDSTEREELKRQAALNPSIAAEINKQWPDTPPSDPTLIHHLIINLGFNEETASKVAKIIKQNNIFTTLSPSNLQSLNEEITNGGDIMNESLNISPTKNVELKRAVIGTSKLKVERTHDLGGLEITMQFNGEPTESTYEYLKDFIDFKLNQIKKAKKDSDGLS